MVTGILGRKVGMTQVYDDTGTAIPVTVLEAGPCHVLQVKTPERDGYEAVQLGYGDKARGRAKRSERGHVAALDSKRARRRTLAGAAGKPKAGCEPKRFVRELRGEADGYTIGQQLNVGVFHPALQKLAQENDIDLASEEGRKKLAEEHAEAYEKALAETISSVDITGISKGRGTAGVMKRHNFAGQRASHGVKKCHRHLGGTGCSASPSRLFKGIRMPGRYGNAKCTVRNLKIVRVDLDNNLLLVHGAVPGPNGGFVVIRETNKLG